MTTDRINREVPRRGFLSGLLLLWSKALLVCAGLAFAGSWLSQRDQIKSLRRQVKACPVIKVWVGP